jgi:glycyl-tRNA synthetase beta chain
MSGVISKPLLIELFTEELPPKALERIARDFAMLIYKPLQDQWMIETPHLISDDPDRPDPPPYVFFATPRRIALRVDAVRRVGLEVHEKKRLMPLSVASDAEGKPNESVRKKLAALGYDGELKFTGADDTKIEAKHRLVVESDGKTEYVYVVGVTPGKQIVDAVQFALTTALSKLPIPKTMTYQLADGITDISFVRPAHGLVVLHGEDVIPVTALGLDAGRITHGHRFQGANNIEIDTASRYEELLRQYGKVEPVFATRRDMILSQLESKAKALNATLGAPASYADLLDEVNSLVEWPTVYVCEFEKEFLAVPQECLILTMKTNQKYFPLFDASEKLKNQFLIVSNMELDDPGKIIQGNERVVRPRLADARFFFETDKKTKLADRVQQLANVVYHNKLGTQGERVQRLVKLAGEIATMIGADKAKAERAALLAKADLPTLMVGEFPELQGTMGRYYALADGEAADVAAACEQHYMPRFAGDRLPDAGVPTAVALADKLETLSGLFGIGQIPTGDKDPSALRRHALGVIRIIVESGLQVSLRDLIKSAINVFPGWGANSPIEIESFIFDRLRGYLRDQGFSSNEIESVVEWRPDRLAPLPRQLIAVREFVKLPEAPSLAAANKRVVNILRKAQEAGESFSGAEIDTMTEVAERDLFDALRATIPNAENLFANGDYTGYLTSFAVLKTPVDEFFDKVMVMADDKAVRANRLALLRDLRDAMNKVADLSKLAT